MIRWTDINLIPLYKVLAVWCLAIEVVAIGNGLSISPPHGVHVTDWPRLQRYLTVGIPLVAAVVAVVLCTAVARKTSNSLWIIFACCCASSANRKCFLDVQSLFAAIATMH